MNTSEFYPSLRGQIPEKWKAELAWVGLYQGPCIGLDMGASVSFQLRYHDDDGYKRHRLQKQLGFDDFDNHPTITLQIFTVDSDSEGQRVFKPDSL